MALVRFGGGIVQASGSIAGNVHARNRFGNYIRPRTKPVNPNSAGQVLMRSIISSLVQRWRVTLTAAQRTAWATYASAIQMSNKLGESINLTGLNHYVRSNSIKLQATYVEVDAGPTVLALPEKDPTLSLVADASDQKLVLTINETLPWFTEPNAFLQVEQGQPQNVTRNFFGGPWKFAGVIPTGDVAPHDLTAPFTLVTGQKTWIACRVSRADGRLSEIFYASATVQA